MLSPENRALFNRVLSSDGRWWDAPLTEGEVNRLLDAARAEGRQAAEEQRKALVEAVKPFADVPSHGEHGGPMVSVRILYEDMLSTDVHIGTGKLLPSHFAKLRNALSETELRTSHSKGTPNDSTLS